MFSKLNRGVKKIKASGIRTPKLSFNNPSFKVKSQTFATPLGFALSGVDLFNNATDAKINSYSAMILSNKKSIENTLGIESINPVFQLVNNTNPENFVYLASSVKFNSTVDGVDKILYMKAIKGEDDVWRTGWVIQEETGTGFGIEFRNHLEATVFFISEDTKYHLKADGTFTTVYNSFVPVWNPSTGLLTLVVAATSGSYISAPALTEAQLNTTIPPVILNVSSTGGTFIDSGIMRVTPFAFFESDISSRWNEYEGRAEISSQKISTESLSGIETSFLTTMEYDTISETGLKFNVIQTKDILDRTNIQGRNSYLLKGERKDEVNHRFYTGLFTGIEEEKGLNSPIFSYLNLTGVINAEAGSVTTFHMPSSMGPYLRLNVNDSTLFESGAIAAETPILADKVYKKRKNYVSDISDDATGVYLCTWLYTPDNGKTAVWLDRYYNPIMKKSADSIYDGVSEIKTVVEHASSQNSYVASLIGKGYFDKKSDLAFEPLAEYQYYRLDETLLGAYVDNVFSSSILDIQEAPAIRDVSNTDAMKERIDAFTLSLSISKEDWKTRAGHTVITNKNGEGFALYNDVYSNTYTAVNLGSKIQIINTKFEEIYTIFPKDVWGDLGQTFSYVYSHGLGDYLLVLLSNGFIAKVSFEGEVRESKMLAPMSIVGHSFDYDTNTVSLFTSTGEEKKINWFTLDTTSSSTTVKKRINFDNRTLEVFSDRVEIDGILMDDTNLENVVIQDASVNHKNDIVVLHRKVSGTTGDIAIYDASKKLIRVISEVSYFTATNVEFVKRSAGDFILLTVGNTLIELDYFGKQTNIYDFAEPILPSSLSATSALRNYFGNLKDTDMVFDFRLNFYGSVDAATTFSKTTIDFAALPPGEQFISIVFDSIDGKCEFYLNSKKIFSKSFDEGIFVMKNGFKTQFNFGSPLVGFNNRIQTYINEMPYIRTEDVSFSAYALYSKKATSGQISAIMRRNVVIPDLHLILPFGCRAEIEETKVFYRMGIPGRKDSSLEVKIKGIDSLRNLDSLLLSIQTALNNENPISTGFSISNG